MAPAWTTAPLPSPRRPDRRGRAHAFDPHRRRWPRPTPRCRRSAPRHAGAPRIRSTAAPREVRAVVVEQERLHVQRFHAEGGIGAHVDRRPVATSSMDRHARVDALARQEEPGPRPQVRGGESEPSTATVPGDDLPVEHEAPPEGLVGPVQIATRQRLADRRGGDRRALRLPELHDIHLETQRRPHRGQPRHRARRPVPEREVGAHRRNARVHALHQHAAHEVLRGDKREVAVEDEDHEDVDPGLSDQPGLPFDGREEPRLAARGQYLARMAVEGDRDRAHPSLPCVRDRVREDGAVTEMHAVEETDGDDRGLVGAAGGRPIPARGP